MIKYIYLTNFMMATLVSPSNQNKWLSSAAQPIGSFTNLFPTTAVRPRECTGDNWWTRWGPPWTMWRRSCPAPLPGERLLARRPPACRCEVVNPCLALSTSYGLREYFFFHFFFIVKVILNLNLTRGKENSRTTILPTSFTLTILLEGISFCKIT